MLKLSKAKHQQAALTAQFTRQQHRNITSRRLVMGESQSERKLRPMLDMYALSTGNLGTTKLNREHRYNTLTPNFVNEVHRGIESWNRDNNCSTIYFTTAKGEHFCNGTDFRTIAHMKKEEEHQKITNYLQDIYGLQTHVAGVNKTLLTAAPGHAFNSGATLLAASNLPFATLDTKVAFNECTFGFVPHAGATYYLTRLPGEMGTFLSLTGKPMHGVDAYQLKLVDGIIHMPHKHDKVLEEIVRSQEIHQFSGKDIYRQGKEVLTPYMYETITRLERLHKGAQDDIRRLENSYRDSTQYDRFIEAKDRIPSSVGEAEYNYLTELRKDVWNREEHDNHKKNTGYLEVKDRVAINYLQTQNDYVKSHILDTFPSDYTLVVQHQKIIDRCFYANSVEEIMENLRKETHPFAQEALQRMENNSMLSMKLALRMLRKAKNLDYKGSLQMEMDVACNKIRDEDFDLGVSEVLMNRTQKPRNPGFQMNINDKDLDRYFEPSQWSKQIKLDCVENALLPAKHYYRNYTDQVRLWINEQSTPQDLVRDTFNQEVKEALAGHGIDIRDKSMTVKEARKALWQQIQVERRAKEQMDRNNQLMSDEKLRDKYYNQVAEELKKYDENEHFYRAVNEHVATVFQNAYLERLNNQYEKGKEAHGLEKRRLLLKFKKFLFKSRILTVYQEEYERLQNQLASMPFKEIHLKENWDQSYRDMQHPLLEKSIMHHLSSVVKKQNFTPVEMTKAYLTTPNARDLMESYVFDKNDIEKLRDDIFANPEKYEEILRQKEPEDFQDVRLKFWDKTGNIRYRSKEEDQEYFYWYMVYNDGHNPYTSLPYYREYYGYKDWVDQIEERAVDSLKFAVNSLLHDFNEHSGHQYKEFEKDKKDTKRESLKRLLVQLNERTESVPKEVVPKVMPKSKKNFKSQSTLNDTRTTLNNVLKKDPIMSHFFGEQEHDNNKLCQKFREEAFNELLQMIELVLLQKYGNKLSKTEKSKLEQRLTNLNKPDMNEEAAKHSLGFIDNYLANRNAEQVLTTALDTIGPYFFLQFSEKLIAESKKTLEAFHWEQTNGNLLHYYLLNKIYPHVRNEGIINRLQTWNEERIRHNAFEAVMPTESENYREKNLIGSLGKDWTEKYGHLSLEQQKQETLNELAEDMQTLGEARDLPMKREELYMKEINQRNSKRMQKPYDMYSMDGITLGEDSPDIDFVNDREKFRANDFEAHSLQVYKWIDENNYEVENCINEYDWLTMYADSIRSYDLQFPEMVRQSLSKSDYLKGGHLDKASKLFDKEKVTWEQLAEHADYITKMYQSILEIKKNRNHMKHLNQVGDFLASTSTNHRNDNLREHLIFKNAQVDAFADRERLSREIDSFRNIQDNIIENAKVRQQILRKLEDKNTSKENRKLVTQILDDKSKFIDLNNINEMLDQGKQLTVKDCIDSQKLFEGTIRSEESARKFLVDYLETPLDVVSLEQLKQQIKELPITDLVKAKHKSEVMQQMIDHIDEQLQYVSHQRRQQMTLREFIGNDNMTAVSKQNSLSVHTYDVLKKRIEKLLGKVSDETHYDNMEWSYGQGRHRTNSYDVEIGNQFEDMEETIKNMRNLKVESESDSNMTLREKLEKHIEYGSEKRNVVEAQVLDDAIIQVQTSEDNHAMKNYYQNKVLLAMTDLETMDTKQIEEPIEMYMRLRLKECMLKQGFQQKIKGQNGHIYLKALREKVLEELKLDKEAHIHDLSLINHDENWKFDVESPQNLLNLNNTDAIGYENLLKRAEGTDAQSNRDAAHETIFDKMQAEYFLNKRGEFKKSNELYQDLMKIFDDKELQYPDGHPLKTTARNERREDAFHYDGDNPDLNYKYNAQSVGKDDKATLKGEDFTDLMELDAAVNNALENNKNGLSRDLRQDYSAEWTEIPEYFDVHDARKPVDKYVNDKLFSIIEEAFAHRKKVETTLSRRELVAYDEMLCRYLEKNSLLPKLRHQVSQDYVSLYQSQQLCELADEKEKDLEIQMTKRVDRQKVMNHETKDMDSLYKMLAYNMSLEQKNSALSEIGEDHRAMYELDSFEEYYKYHLELASKRPARKFDPNDYAAMKPWEKKENHDKEFKYRPEREAEFFKEFELYGENKKEQQERIQAFYILEQFFESARQNPDSTSEAQKHINEYFSDPDNTYFFDKNKIF